MDTKNLSPAFLTSLGLIIVGAFALSTSSVFLVILGWILLLVGLALNVFSVLVLIQKIQGAGTLTEMIARADAGAHSSAVDAREEVVELRRRRRPLPAEDNKVQLQAVEDSEPVTEAQEIVAVPAETVEEEPIFNRKRPRVRNR